MGDWNAERYLRFEAQRTQPARDLAARLRGRAVRTAADIGCGPGNSTAVLAACFPEADIAGIDPSPDMLEKARAQHPSLRFEQGDARQLEGGWDLLFSNACLQWVPDHRALLPFLMSRLNADGALAVQMPKNREEPLFRLIRELAAEPGWHFSGWQDHAGNVLQQEDYYDILAGCSARFDLWQTRYCHPMPDHAALLEWVKGSSLRPLLEALPAAEAEAFEAELLRRVQAAYPLRADGSVLLRFLRVFFVAEK